MGGLAGVASIFARTPGLGLPPLPGGLGLPEKGVAVGAGIGNHGREGSVDFNEKKSIETIAKQRAQAETYNKAFAELLNYQPQLNGEERSQLYKAYSTKLTDQAKGRLDPLTDYGATLSQLTPDQFRAEQQKLAAQAPAPAPAQAPAPAASAPAAPVSTPLTVGPTPKPQVEQPAPTPVVATAGGNVAGNTTTNNSDTKQKGGARRGRMTTLLTGLGGAVERFGA